MAKIGYLGSLLRDVFQFARQNKVYWIVQRFPKKRKKHFQIEKEFHLPHDRPESFDSSFTNARMR